MDIKKAIIFRGKSGRRYCIDTESISCVNEIGAKSATEDKPTKETEIHYGDGKSLIVDMILEEVLTFIAKSQGIEAAPKKPESSIVKPDPRIQDQNLRI